MGTSGLHLETERLILRALAPEDLGEMATLLGDDEALVLWGGALDREGARSWIERNMARYASHGLGRCAVIWRETGELGGDCGLVPTEVEGVPEVELGWITRRDFWVIPGLTDHEIPAVVKKAREAGVICAGCIPLRLPHGVGDLFVDWLDRHFPHRKKKVIDQIRSMRGGNLNDGRLGHRMDGDGIVAEQIAKLFAISCRRAQASRKNIPNCPQLRFVARQARS